MRGERQFGCPASEERKPWHLRLYRCVFGLLLCGASLQASPIFYSISGDSNGIPRVFNSINLSGAVTSPFNLGDGSLGFNGGLAYRPSNNLFYAVANDGNGASSLVSFSALGGGAFTSLFSLGSGFVSGLTLDSSDGFFYAIDLDNTGFSTLDRIDAGLNTVSPLFGLGFGFMGGLTFDPNNGLFYALSADGNGVQRVLNSISLSGAITSPFTLGDGSLGFNGGLSYDPVSNKFYVISNDNQAFSTLDSFTLSGAPTLTALFGVGVGFGNVGLTGVQPVPEPYTLLFAGWVLLLFFKFKRENHSPSGRT